MPMHERHSKSSRPLRQQQPSPPTLAQEQSPQSPSTQLPQQQSPLISMHKQGAESSPVQQHSSPLMLAHKRRTQKPPYSVRQQQHPRQRQQPATMMQRIQKVTVAGSVGSVFWEVATFWVKVAYNGIITPIKEQRVWQTRMSEAMTFSEWSAAATELDRLEGKARWKYETKSKEYDYELVESRLEQLQRAREMNDEAAISFLLRTSMARNFGGINNERLYTQSRVGTKALIEDFTAEIVTLLKGLAGQINLTTNPIELKKRMDFFKDLRHSLGNTALSLSGGASLGVYHIGVLKALFEAKLLPRIIAGSSSGSIMAAIACCRTDEEIPSLVQLEGINTNMLEEDVPNAQKTSWLYPFTRKLSRFLSHGVVFDGAVLKESLRSSIGDVTFSEAYKRTNRVLNIAVSSTTMYDMPRLLNYITAPNVLVWSAVVASCAVPALYESAPLLARDHTGKIVPWNVTGDLWCDGSLENDLPMERLTEIFNVNHFIVSQVNPHITPFVKRTVGRDSRLRSFNHKIMFLVRSEINYRLDQIANLGILPRICQMIKSITSQKYYGDITILPELSWGDLAHMFVDRPVEAILKAIHRGEAATWPKLSLIRSQLQVELALDEILLTIRDRMVASASIGEDVFTNDKLAASADIMLDPKVDIRRHLSPSLSASHSFLSQGNLHASNGQLEMWTPPKRSKSIPLTHNFRDRTLTD